MAYQEDKELNAFRNLVEPPSTFEDGFNVKTIIGALFVGLLVTPGSIYIMLVAGEGVGPAARWVTIFLFSEVARRSLKELRQQEVFVLYYMTSHVLVTHGMIMMSPLWRVFMAKSEAFQAMGITDWLPNWVVPVDALQAGGRDMFTMDWVPALALMALTMAISKVDHFGLGYFLYRITSDVERLPFPMAPIAASGILAMAETKDRSLQWRPACFSIGGVLGLLFGLVYMGIPAVTGVFLREPIFIIPIPWIELTPATQDYLPATAVNLVPNLAMLIMGMVLPFWAIIGGFLGLIFTFLLNPILYDGGILRSWFGIDYHGGVLHTWRPGMLTVETLFSNQLDFYLSFGLGITFFIAFLGILQAVWPLIRGRAKPKKERTTAPGLEEDERTGWERLVQGKPGRGDISAWLALVIYICTTISYIAICVFLVPGFPWPLFLVYGFLYTPLISYASAKVEGLAGQHINIPMVREATFILSGYKGVAIWYAPIPIHNYTVVVKDFRVIELTGTRLSSIIKTDLVSLPIIVTSLIVFSGFIWAQADLNSDQYPYVQRVWDLQAKNQALVVSSTLEGRRSPFFEALKGDYLAWGFLGAAGLYGVLSLFGLPVLLVFGVVRGLGQTNPGGLLPELIGALVGRYYFQRKYGEMWRKYTPAMFAGFSCGVGLVGMMAVAFRLIATAASPLQY